MNIPAPVQLRCGDYARHFPHDTEADRDAGRQMMRRNGCKCVRFEVLDDDRGIVAHGYIGTVSGQGVEPL